MSEPFSLERAKAGDPVMTKSGLRVRLLCFDAKSRHPIAGLIEEYGKERVQRWTEAGTGYISPGEEGGDDLVMAPKKVKLWMRIFKYSHNGKTSYGSMTIQEPEQKHDFGYAWVSEWMEFEVEE